MRVSGPLSRSVALNLAGSVPKPRQATLRNIRAGKDGQLLDRGMVLFFEAPHSATGEDVLEFHVHGGPAVVDGLLRALTGIEGLVLARPGEFTRRAFENGVLDLVEVEGLGDLLAAETESQRRVAMRQFSGEASAHYKTWRDQLLNALAYIEASIDFTDEAGVAEAALANIVPILKQLTNELSEALEASRQASAVRRGLRIVLAGAPNVGKSSLLNALAGRDAAIVSPIAGTTRDVIQAPLVVEGVPVLLADTAGLRSSATDPIEEMGMSRTRVEIADADVLIWVAVAGEAVEQQPVRTPDIVVWNKSDLHAEESIQPRNDWEVASSAKTGAGMAELRERLSQLVKRKTDTQPNAVMVRLRHQQAVEQSIRLLNDALKKDSSQLELMAEDVRKAAHSLAGITGRVDVEELLGQIFSEFCIGK